jgi:hypothetical protein
MLGLKTLEPISKLFEEHRDAGQLHEPQEVGGVILPANEKPTLPLEPGKEAFDEPATFIPAYVTPILGLEFARGAMGRNTVDAILLEVVIEAIAVIRPIANEMLGFRLQHVEVETELDQGHFMMIRRMPTDGEGESVPIHTRKNLHAFPAFREAHVVPAALRGRKGGIDETLALVNRAFVPQRIGQLREDLPQHLLLTPLLESAMHRLVVGIALRQEVPLRARIQNPEHRFQDRPGGDGLPLRTGIRDLLFRKVFANPLPLIVAQPQHARTYTDGSSCRQLF